MSDKLEKNAETSFKSESSDKKTDDSTFKRWALCFAITEVLEGIVGKNIETDEPRLTNPHDECSDLVVNLKFGEELDTEIRVPHEGKMTISNKKVLVLLFDCRKKIEEILKEFSFDPLDILEAWY